METFKNTLFNNLIIPSVTTPEELDFFLKHTSHNWVCLKMGDINSLVSIVSIIHKNKRKVMLHLDSIKGIAKDKDGIKYLKRIGIDAIITMKSQHLKMIREENIFSILGSFIVDSAAVSQTLQNIKTGKPDAILIMPMTVPSSVYQELHKEIPCIIVGGLGKEHDAIQDAFDHGACACIVSDKKRITEKYI